VTRPAYPPREALARCRRLADDAALQQAAARASPDDPSAVARLRRSWSADMVHAALDLADARRRAAVKFPHADQLMLDRAGVEQATALPVARHKAARFHALGEPVVDLCCGIGGDAMALAERLPVMLIDREPARAWSARWNVRRQTPPHPPEAAAADVDQLNLRGRLLHLDPARRNAAGRIFRYADCRPGPETMERLLARNPDMAIKLAPGIDPTELPAGELEFISHAGSLVQAVRWCGRLRRAARSATVIDATGVVHSLQAERHDQLDEANPPPAADLDDYLFTVDPAVERARLIGWLCRALDLGAVHPALGLLTGDRAVDSPFLTGFKHLTTMPWREKKVRAWLAHHEAGVVEVKTRGRAVNPDALQKRLRGTGRTTFTVFIYRHEQRLLAHITRRLPEAP